MLLRNLLYLIYYVMVTRVWNVGQGHIRESLPQLENQIIARVYVRCIMHSTMYQKAPFC